MTIKVGTVNIWNGRSLDFGLVPFLLKECFDILFLQEVFNGQDPSYDPSFRVFDILKNELQLPYSTYGPQFKAIYEHVQADRGNAIFSKFPLEYVDNYFFSIPYKEIKNEMQLDDWRESPRNMLHSRVHVNGLALDLLNIHGIWDFHGNDSPYREQMLRVILEKIKDKNRVLLAGDFNMFPTTVCIDTIEKHLINVFKDEFVTTFNLKHKDPAAFGSSVVDMMFISSEIKVVNHYMPDVDISDHMPLIAELEVT